MARLLVLAPLLLAAACTAPSGPQAGNGDSSAGNEALGSAPSPSASSPAAPAGSASQPVQQSGGMPVPPNPSNDCANVTARDFAAWVNAMPGPGSRPTLIVTGKVDTPTGGYRVLFTDMRVAESHPVQVTAELAAVPPEGAATQAVVTHEVRGSWPMSPPVGSVTVRCGVKTLARIAPVETAH